MKVILLNEVDQKSRVCAVEVYYGSRADAGKSAAEITKKREKDFGAGTALVTRAFT